MQVIPHGNAWRAMWTMDTKWDEQLDPENHDPEMQNLIEIYSKHGNSEEYKDFPPNYRYYRDGREVSQDECATVYRPSFRKEKVNSLIQRVTPLFSGPDFDPPYFYEPKKGCEKVCQEPTEDYIPCCWRAAEIVRERCVDPESEFCKAEMALARKEVRPFFKGVPKKDLHNVKSEFRDDPGANSAADWQSCGQCRTCYQPASHYTQMGSVQKALASAYFDADGKPFYYKFGFIGSTDTHSAWGGSVKETKRMAELMGGVASRSIAAFRDFPGWERGANFLNPGSLVGVVSPRRTRDDLWNALESRNVYSTSGPRIEVWSRAEVSGGIVDMGAETTSSTNPTFHLRANGAFEEDPTCPYQEEADIKAHLSAEDFQNVCLNQCYRITDNRVKIKRIEVIKILQPLNPEERDMEKLIRTDDNPDGLIMDPYYVENVNGDAIEWSWTDKEFVKEPDGRNVAYYFRVIQEPTEGYNCNPIYMLEQGKVCNDGDPDQFEIEAKINPQDGSEPVKLSSIPDTCYTDVNDPKTYCEERAWTSPFYIVKE